MKTIQAKILFIALLLSTAVPSLPAEMDQTQKNLLNDLIVAVQGGDVAGVEQVTKASAYIDIEFPEEITKMIGSMSAMLFIANFHACGTNNIDTIRPILEQGADVNGQLSNGSTALSFASMAGCSKMVDLLLEYRAGVNIQNNDGKTALMMAADGGGA